MDGQVLALHAEPGAHAAAYQPILTIGDLSQLEVSAEVSTSALEELTAGMPVTIQAVTGGGGTASGTIRLLPGIAPSSGDEDRAIRIEIDPALAGNFALGDLVEVFVEIDRRTDVLWLPPQAIRSFSGRRFVVVQDGANQRSIDVELGLRGQNRIEIIPVEGQETVEEGQIVLGP
jgi:multidrug efflux pump subunit AcrA (membrane-fusion protein)